MSDTSQATQGPRSWDAFAAEQRGMRVPPWLLSLLLHGALLVVVGLMVVPSVPEGAAPEVNREAGIVLARESTEGTREYFTADDQGTDAQHNPGAEQSEGENNPDDAIFESLPRSLEQSAGNLLNEALAGLGSVSNSTGELGSASDLITGSSQGNNAIGGLARVTVFGVEGEGSRFVYVFDRSISMEQYGALEAAKQALVASLKSLGKTHQFQIIFYSSNITLFDSTGRLIFGTDQKKRLAERFVLGITAMGNTRHKEALEAAVRMHPDVIFFLSDADYPQLTDRELRGIRRRNGGRTIINTIEFGFGPDPGGDNFLRKLAAQNHGQYSYTNISTFRSSN